MKYPRSYSRRQADLDDFPDDETSPPGESSEKMKHLLLGLLARWHWLALGLILGVLAGLYYLSKAPKIYRTTASLMVKTQTNSLMKANITDGIDPRGVEAMNTVAARLQSRELLERVAASEELISLPNLVPVPTQWLPDWWTGSASTEAATAAGAKPPAAAELGAMISGWLHVSVRRGTRLLDVAVSHPDPDVAKKLADTIVSEYLAEIQNARRDMRGEAIQSLQTQADQERDKLEIARSALAVYSRALSLSEELSQNEAELSRLRLRYLPKHPKLVTAVAAAQSSQQQFIRQFELARQSPADHEHWAKAKLPDAASTPDDYLPIARQLLQGRVGVLQDEITNATQVFNSMLTSIEETSINQLASFSDSFLELASQAALPTAPATPVARKIVGMGAFLGLGLGTLVAFLRLTLDDKFHSVAQIAGETGVPVLGVLGDLTASDLAAAGKRCGESLESATPQRPGWNERLVFRPAMRDTPQAEMYRSLRVSVSLLGDEASRKVTLFTSALPGEGKSMVSANFALASASQGRKTLLVDLDLRRPTIHTLFGMLREADHCGISEVLAGQASLEDAVARDGKAPNLHLITAGKNPPNPGMLLTSGRLNEFLARACDDYDVVVLDSAPLLPVTDTRMIAPLAHNVCLIARAERTPKGAVLRAIDLLVQDGVPLSGIVLNGHKNRRSALGARYYGYNDKYYHATGYEAYSVARR